MSGTAATWDVGSRAARAPSSFAQLFGVFGGAVAWNAQIVSSFALTAHPCFERRAARASLLPGWDSVALWALAINAAAVVVTAIALLVAWHVWRWGRNQEAHVGPEPRLVTRTWAMGLAGVLSSGILLGASIFALVAMLGTPVCAR